MSVDGVISWAKLHAAGGLVELWGNNQPEPVRGGRGWTPIVWPGPLTQVPLHLPLELLALGAAQVRIATNDDDETHARRWEQWSTLYALVGRQLMPPVGGRAKRSVLHAEAMPTIQRRALFGLSKSSPTPQRWTPDVAATSHQRLRAALRELGANTASAVEATHVTSPVPPDSNAGAATSSAVASEHHDEPMGPGILLAAAGCTAQGQCVQACPQEALQLVTEGETSTLTFDVSRCDGCRRCIDFCDANALHAHAAAPWSAVLEGEPKMLASITTRRCERCRVAFAPSGDETLCAVCTARRANPFGSSLPPEAIARLRRMREAN